MSNPSNGVYSWLDSESSAWTVVAEPSLRTLGDQAGKQVFGAAEPRFGDEYVLARLAELCLVLAARVVAYDPIDLASQEVAPQRLDVLARTDRRVDLRADTGSGIDVGE
jgi:hypothetical protein